MKQENERLRDADKTASRYGMVGIGMERDGTRVTVEQLRYDNETLLTHNELRSRAEEVYEDLGIKSIDTIMATPDLNTVTPKWVKNNMKRLCLKQQEVAKHIGVTSPHLSRELQKDDMTAPLKAVLFYYFHYLISGEESRAESSKTTRSLIDLIKENKRLKEELRTLKRQEE